MGPLLPILGEIFKGFAIRSAFSGGFTGAVSRIGLYEMAKRNAAANGTQLPVSASEAAGALAQDYGTLGKSILGLARNVGSLSSVFSRTNLQPSMFSQGQAMADEIRRAGQMQAARLQSRETAESELSKSRSESLSEEVGAISNSRIQKATNSVGNFFRDILTYTETGLNKGIDELTGDDSVGRMLRDREERRFAISIPQSKDTPLNNLARDIANGLYGGRKTTPLPPME